MDKQQRSNTNRLPLPLPIAILGIRIPCSRTEWRIRPLGASLLSRQQSVEPASTNFCAFASAADGMRGENPSRNSRGAASNRHSGGLLS